MSHQRPEKSTLTTMAEAVVGSILQHGRALLRAAETAGLLPDHLSGAVRVAYEACITLDRQGEEITLLSASQALADRRDHTLLRFQGGADAYLATLTMGSLVSASGDALTANVRALLRAWREQRAQELAAQLQDAARRGDLEAMGRLGRELEALSKPPAAGPPRRKSRSQSQDGWQKSLVRDKNGGLVKCLENLVTILVHDERWEGVLGWNDLTGMPEAIRAPPWHPDDEPTGAARPGEWSDEDALRVRTWLGRSYSLRAAKVDVEDAIRIVVQRNRFHPVRDYLQALRWDGVPRVDTWLTRYLGVADSPYARNVGRWWMVGAVARVMIPGCMLKTLLILEGPQDLKKSTAARILGGKWFKDTSLALGGKDAYIGLKGCWIREIPELDGLSKYEAAHIKAFISSPSDSYRPPFGKLDRTHPRSCAFIGTVNPEEGVGYLKDATGGSRFWPVRCAQIDADALERDRDQLWAEALQWYRSEPRWWAETQEEKAACALEQDERYQQDALEPLIDQWLQDVTRNRLHPEHMTLSEGRLTMDIILRLGARQSDPTRWDRALQTRVGQALHRLGWVARKRTVADGRRRVVYLHPDIHPALL